MSYKITHEPLNKIRGVTPSTVEIETAVETLSVVEALICSDEKVTEIIDPSGRLIAKYELERFARMESE